MLRTPLRTRLLRGQETNRRLGSSRTTSMVGSAIRTYLAAVAPPHPPPTTTTRRPRLASSSPVLLAQPASPAVATTTPLDDLRNSRRVTPPMPIPSTRLRQIAFAPPPV